MLLENFEIKIKYTIYYNTMRSGVVHCLCTVYVEINLETQKYVTAIYLQKITV